MITASKIPRLMACPSSEVMARAELHSEWADMGNDEHDDLSNLADLPPELAKLVPPGSKAEVKLAYDTATGRGRIIGEGAGREYGDVGPFEIAGSTDVVGLTPDHETAVIVDWKTGYLPVEAAATNGQLWFYALAACRAMGLDAAIVRIVYTKTGRVDQHEIGPLEFAEFAGRLRQLQVTIAKRQAQKQRGEILETREGSWCKYCPSKAYCPSKNALLVQFGKRGLAVVGDTTLTKDDAVEAYRQVQSVDQLLKEAKRRLEVYVDENGPLDLGDGKLYGRFKRPGDEKLDARVVSRAIGEFVGEQAAEFRDIALEPKATKAGIKRACKQLFAKGASKVEAAIVDKVRDLGGSKRGDEYPIGEYASDKYASSNRSQMELADAIDQLMQAATP